MHFKSTLSILLLVAPIGCTMSKPDIGGIYDGKDSNGKPVKLALNFANGGIQSGMLRPSDSEEPVATVKSKDLGWFKAQGVEFNFIKGDCRGPFVASIAQGPNPNSLEIVLSDNSSCPSKTIRYAFEQVYSQAQRNLDH